MDKWNVSPIGVPDTFVDRREVHQGTEKEMWLDSSRMAESRSIISSARMHEQRRIALQNDRDMNQYSGNV